MRYRERAVCPQRRREQRLPATTGSFSRPSTDSRESEPNGNRTAMPSLSHGRGAQRHRSPAGRRRLSVEAGQVDKATRIDVRPPTSRRWPDLEAIFGAKGCSVARGCWCMAYRVSGSAPALPAGTTRAGIARRPEGAGRYRPAAGTDRLCDSARRNRRRSLSGRQARALRRRGDVVRLEIDVRRRGIRGGCEAQSDAACSAASYWPSRRYRPVSVDTGTDTVEVRHEEIPRALPGTDLGPAAAYRRPNRALDYLGGIVQRPRGTSVPGTLRLPSLARRYRVRRDTAGWPLSPVTMDAHTR